MKQLSDVHLISSHRRAREVMRYFESVVDGAFSFYHHHSDFVRELKKQRDDILAQIPFDAVTKNCLDIVFPHKRVLFYDTMQVLYDFMKERFKVVHAHLDEVILNLPKIGAQKIKQNVFVYGHEHDVLNVLLAAYALGQKFEVHMTEQRVTQSGKLFAQELLRHGIVVHFYADCAIRQAVKQCDIVLIGANAIDYHMKVYTTIGAELACIVAKHRNVPVYICCDSWTYDADLSISTNLGDPKQLWDAPAGVRVHHYDFEKISPLYINGIICELGILAPNDFFLKVKKTYETFF
jgi:translation initiation factor 2B subunit (eIF-2B alpha/beta/delta family)